MKYKLFRYKHSDSQWAKYRVESPYGEGAKFNSIYNFWNDDYFRSLTIDGINPKMSKVNGKWETSYRDYDLLIAFNDGSELFKFFRLNRPDELMLTFYRKKLDSPGSEFIIMDHLEQVMTTNELMEVLTEFYLPRKAGSLYTISIRFIREYEKIGIFKDLLELKNYIRTEMPEELI